MNEMQRKLDRLGITLPVKNRAGKAVLPLRQYRDLLFVSGHCPTDEEGNPVYQGRVGSDLTIEEGYQAARLCGINMLATLKDYVGDLDRIDYVVKVLGLVSSAPEFSSQPAVVHGFSDLMVEVFGARGTHARSAMGTFNLPGNSPVEVEAIFKIRG